MLRIETHLSDELENLIHRTIGCCIEVHRALGPGLPERAYTRAVCLFAYIEAPSRDADELQRRGPARRHETFCVV